MNIFILDLDPELCARYHCNSHVIKMQLELQQMLSTAYRCYNPNTPSDLCFKSSYINHPCNIWCRSSKQNFEWAKTLLLELEKEWRFRYNHPETKRHKGMYILDNINSNDLPDIGLTKFSLAMPNDCKNKDPVKAYRNYYNIYKRQLFDWGKREIPDWIELS